MSFDPSTAEPLAASPTFDPTSAAPSDDALLRAQIRRAMGTDALRASQASQLAFATGLPPDVALRNFDQLKRESSVAETARALEVDPLIGDYFRYAPLFAAKAQKDASALVDVHGTIKAFKGPEPTFENIARGLAASMPQGLEMARRGMQGQMRDFLQWAGLVQPDPVEDADLARKIAQSQSASDFTRPNIESRTGRAIYGGVESTLRTLPGLAASIATRSPTPMLATMGVQTQAEAYGKYRTRGGAPLESFLGATGEGAVEVATELLPTKFLTDSLGKRGVGEFLAGLIAREVPTEQVATFLQDAIDTSVANPDKTWPEFFAERPGAAYDTLVSTLTQSLITGGAVATLNKIAGTADQMGQAEASARQLQNVFAAASMVQMRAHAPQDFASAMQDLAQREGATESIFMDAEVLAQSGIDIAQSFPSAAAQMEDALALNTVVELPLGEVLAAIPGTPLEELFLQNARTSENAWSLAEASQIAEQGQQFIEQEAERVLQQAQDQSAWQTEVDTVRDTIKAQLDQAGRFTSDANEAYARLQSAFFSTMASRTGMTPTQFYEEFSLKVGAQAGQGAVLNAWQQPEFATDSADENGNLAPMQSSEVDPVADALVAQLQELGFTVAGVNGSTTPSGRSVYIPISYTPRASQDPNWRRDGRIPAYVLNTEIRVSDHGTGAARTGNYFHVNTKDQAAKVVEEFQRQAAELDQRILREQQDIDSRPNRAARRAAARDSAPEPTLNDFIDSGVDGQALHIADDVNAPAILRDGLRAASDGYVYLWANGLDADSERVMREARQTRNPDLGWDEAGAIPDAYFSVDLAALQDRLEPDPYTDGGMRVKGDIPPEALRLWDGQRFVPATGNSGAFDPNAGRDVTQTPEFRAWFGDSKVVDAEGRPLVVYHGTIGKFDEFSTAMRGTNTGARGAEQGFFFAGSRADANFYSALANDKREQQGLPPEETNVFEAFLSAKNPLILGIDDEESSVTGELREQLIDADPEALQYAKENGYDSVIWPYGNANNSDYTVVVFDPTQIKSATGNSGAFDPNDPNVLNQSVSTRVPWAVRPEENHFDEQLVVNMDAARRNPALLEKFAERMREIPSLRTSTAATAEEQLEDYIEQIKSNLIWLHDQFTPDIRARAKLWYDGARVIVDRLEEQYEGRYSDVQLSAAIAALSPQMDWFLNVALATRAIEIWDTQQDTVWDDRMTEAAQRTAMISEENGNAVVLAAVTGKKLSELSSDLERAFWVAAYDLANNSRDYLLVTPEGDFGEIMRTDSGAPIKGSWANGFGPIAKSISVLRDGTMANISDALGAAHKVRNFYNNIYDPTSPDGSVTIDTHAVAAGLLLPLAGSSPFVQHNLGTGGSDSKTGIKGTYPVYAEAYRRAAAEVGLLPREMQSITWEAVRSLFKPTFKAAYNRSLKSTSNAEHPLTALWREYHDGARSLDETRQELLRLSDGIPDPAWARSDRAGLDGAGSPGNTGELYQNGGMGRTSGRGAGGNDAAQTANGELAQGPRGTFNPQQTPPEVEIGRGGRAPSGGIYVSGRFYAGGEFLPEEYPGGKSAARKLSAQLPSYISSLTVKARREGGAWIYARIAGESRERLLGLGSKPFDSIEKALFVANEIVNQRETESQKRGEMPHPTEIVVNDGTLAQGPRGTFNPQTLLISLNESADLSTFLHESGHFFLEVMADLASQPDAPQQVVDDMNRALAWFGVPDLATWNAFTLDEKREHHEKWAEAFEQYLLEGKAPSTELQPLFRRFRSWLVNVYKSLSDFMRGRNLEVNDEIRQVFDRMLATDEQIAQAEEQAGLLPEFDATNEAIERLQERSLRALKWTLNARSKFLKQFTKEARELRKGVLAEVMGEFETKPEVIAARAIRKVRNKDGAERDAKIAAIADATGYPTVEEMTAAVTALGPVNEAVEAEVDRRMLERHGDMATQEALEAAANEAVHNEARARALAAELKSQNEAMNPRETTGRTDARGRPITVNALVEAARAFGADLAARRAVGKLKNAIYLHRAAEARAGRAWQTATQKGDTQAAVQAKKDQLLNNQAVRALLDAQAEVRAAIEFFRKVTKGNNEKLVKGGRDPDVVNAMRAILGVYGIAPRTGKGAMEYLELVQKNDPAMYAVIAPGVNTALANAKPFSELTVEEVRGLTDELKSLWHLAKRSRQMEIDGDLLDLEDLADQLYARMEDIGIPDVLPGEKGALTDAEIRKRNWLQQAPAILRRVEQWAEAKDGAFGGPFLRFIFQPVKIAADSYRADRLVYRRKFQALVDAIEPTMAKTLIAAPELDYTFGRGHNGIGMAEVLHAILHTGNDSNKRKLLLGREWATENPDGTLDTSRWDAFIARLITEGTLTKAHYDFAQGVWDLMEETKPLAQKTHRDVFGRYFAEVTANEVQTPFGTYRGGYVPAQADPLLVQDADQRELLETENAGMSYAFPATNKGFTKGRVEYNRPLKLDLRTLPQHIDKVLLFSHMEPAVRGVDRLLRRKKIAQALNKIDPAAINGMLKPWLNRSARQTVETPVSADAGLNRMLSQARARTGMALMLANVSNTLQQITGFATALLKVKGSHIRRAVAQYIADPQQLKNTVWSLSPYMADRASNEVAVLSDTLEAILLNPSVYESAERFTRRHAYFLQTGMDNQMSPIIWTGAYNQALVEGMGDRMARRFADGVIRQTQGSTLPEDVSRIETGTAFARAFTQFVGYFNMLANTNATAIQQIAQEQGLRKGAGKAFGVLMVGMMIPIWVAEVIAHAMRGGPEDEDDDGYLDDWLAAVFGFGTIRGILSGMPGIAQIGQSMVNRFNDNPADDRFSLSPTVSVLESAAAAPQSVYKAIVDEGSAQKAVRDMSALITLATGLPAMTLARPLGYAAGVAQGKIEPTGPVDAARGLVTGTASPESKNP